MASTAIYLFIVFLAALAVGNGNSTNLLSVEDQFYNVGNETVQGMVVRRWHLDKNELGEPIAFIKGRWNPNGANKCAYNAKDGILYVITNKNLVYGSATIEITGVSVKYPVNRVVKHLPAPPGCTARNFINFDSSSGDIIFSCIAGQNFTINSVNTENGAATVLRAIPMEPSTLTQVYAPGYDEDNKNIALSYSTGTFVGKLTYVPLDSTEPYVTGSNWANMFGPIWTGKEDGSMVSFGYGENGAMITAVAGVDPSTNVPTSDTLAYVQGDITGIWNRVQTYDPVKKILYGVAATAHEINEISEISLVGVKSDTGKVTMEFKKKSQTVPVCLVVE